MAIVQLPLRYELSLEEASQVVEAAGLDEKSRIEAVESWDMVQIWWDWIGDKFGVISAVQHMSGGDDPPDLSLIFSGRVVGFEHSRLQPKHLGQANALIPKAPEGGAIPSISSSPRDFSEMMDIVTGVKEEIVSPVIDEWKTIIELLTVRLRLKMKGQPNGGIIGMVHDLVMGDTNHQMLAEFAHNIVNSEKFPDFSRFTLILLHRWNVFEFRSALIGRGTDILERSQ